MYFTREKKNIIEGTQEGGSQKKAIEIQEDERHQEGEGLEGERRQEGEGQEDERQQEGEDQEDDENVDDSVDTSKKHGHGSDIIDSVRKTKKVNGTDYYMIPAEFLEKLTAQNKVIWKNQIKQDKKLDEISQILKKMHREDALTPAFFEVMNVINVILLRDLCALKLLTFHNYYF